MIMDKDLVAMWFMRLTETSDFLGSLRREGDAFVLAYRFRYYKDDEVFTGKDEKNFYRGTLRNITEEKALQKCRTVVGLLAKAAGYGYDEILMKNGDVEGFALELAQYPWAHMRYDKKEKGGDNVM